MRSTRIFFAAAVLKLGASAKLGVTTSLSSISAICSIPAFSLCSSHQAKISNVAATAKATRRSPGSQEFEISFFGRQLAHLADEFRLHGAGSAPG